MKKKLLIVLTVVLLLGTISSFGTGKITKTRNTITIGQGATDQDMKEFLKTFNNFYIDSVKYIEKDLNAEFINIRDWDFLERFSSSLVVINVVFDGNGVFYLPNKDFSNINTIRAKGLKSFDFKNLYREYRRKSTLSIEASNFINLEDLYNQTRFSFIYLSGNTKNDKTVDYVFSNSDVKNILTKMDTTYTKLGAVGDMDLKDIQNNQGKVFVVESWRFKKALKAPYTYKPELISQNFPKGKNTYYVDFIKKTARVHYGDRPIEFTFNEKEIRNNGDGTFTLLVDKADFSFVLDGKKSVITLEKDNFTTERIEGSSRFQTALKISDKLYTRANTAIIVNANKFPDALTSTVLSKKLKAPILLSGLNEIPESVNLKMKKLGVKNVVIVGGNLVISDKLERQLKTNYSVRRIGGRSRYETSELVANEIGGNGVVVARGDHFADALTISSLALKNDFPIYLTKPNVLTNSTFEKIKRRKPASIFIAGGINAVNTSVESKLKTLSNVTRLGGITRFDTSKKIAEHVYGNNVVNVMIARSDDFADAMVAGPLAYNYQAPILLVDKKGVSPEIKTYLVSRKATIKKGYIVGGTIAVPKVIETELKNIMK